jgi:hypothetical protein
MSNATSVAMTTSASARSMSPTTSSRELTTSPGDRDTASSPLPPQDSSAVTTVTTEKPTLSTLADIRARMCDALEEEDAGHLGRGPSLASCASALEEMLALADAQAEEDFHLLEAVSSQVATTCEADLLATLVRDETGTALHGMMRALMSEREGTEEDERGDGTHGALANEYARARRRTMRKVVALADAHTACRADRMKLLTSMVTASRLPTWRTFGGEA